MYVFVGRVGVCMQTPTNLLNQAPGLIGVLEESINII